MVRKRKKMLAEVGGGCVSCGNCEKACPLSAVFVYKGLYAKVIAARCVGCGKCEAACPAGIITIKEREEAAV